MPVIIRKLTDDEATIIMVDSNIQREDILPSEKAWAYRLKMEAIKHQGSKGERFTADIVGEAAGESGRTVQRYIRLTYLKQELLEYVDEKKLQMMAGEQLSFLTAEEQEWVYDAIENRGIFPSKEQAETLKAESETKTLTVSRVAGILVKAERTLGITIPVLQIRSYFPQDYTKAQMETIIFQLLNAWKEKQDMEVQT